MLENHNMQETDNKKRQKFKCNQCHHLAKNPVITLCGHLFCWECLHEKLILYPSCPTCSVHCETSQCYPIFIDSKDGDVSETPLRPVPRRKQKILNPNMIGAGLPALSVNYPNNIASGKLIVGSIFSPPLVVHSMNTIEFPDINDRDFTISIFSRKIYFIISCIMLIFIYFYFI